MMSSVQGRKPTTNLSYRRSTGMIGVWRSGCMMRGGWRRGDGWMRREGTRREGMRAGGSWRRDGMRGLSTRERTTGRSCWRGLQIWTWRIIMSIGAIKDTMSEVVTSHEIFMQFNETKNLLIKCYIQLLLYGVVQFWKFS